MDAILPSTKAALASIGDSSVISLHTLLCARTPLARLSAFQESTRRRHGLLSTFKGDVTTPASVSYRTLPARTLRSSADRLAKSNFDM